MCGIYAFAGEKPDLDLLRRIAAENGRRGPHSWGLAYRAGGAFRVDIGKGQVVDDPAAPWADLAGPILGHARLATSGSSGLADAQPMRAGGAIVVHNGNVYRHRDLAALYSVVLKTKCDSELLAGIMSTRSFHTGIGAIGPAPYAVAAILDGVLIVAHRGLPLFEARRPEGFYYSSVRVGGMEPVPEEETVAHALAGDPQRTSPVRHPVDSVRWVDPETLHANSYNPNKVFPPEMALLKISILEDGWTQPVVARPDGEVVDGFHRWTLARTDPDIRAKSGGLVPVVFVEPGDRASQMMSTVRHNRARGAHGVLKMAEIVRSLQADGIPDEEIRRRLGMDEEELERLADARSSPEQAGKDSFGKGWVPT